MDNTERLIKKTKKELKEWFDSPNIEDDFLKEPLQKIKSMSEEDKILKSILSNYEDLNSWHSSRLVYASLNSEADIAHRVDLAANSYRTVTLTDALAKVYSNNPPTIMFEYAAFHLANVVVLNWEKEAGAMIKFLNAALETKTLKGGLDFKMTSWFILEIVNKGFGIDYDYSDFNYPDNMGVYQQALDNWNTKDTGLVDKIVSDLCTFHIFQASHGSLSDSAGKSDPMFLQFSHTEWFVYAFEVLTWLAMREKQGLPNPDSFSHPLMQIALNQPVKERTKLPEDDLFNKVLDRIKA